MTTVTTTTSYKSHVKHIAMAVEPGTSGADAIRDAAILALQQNVPVTLAHNHRQYHVEPAALLRLIATQSPLVTGKMTVPTKEALAS